MVHSKEVAFTEVRHSLSKPQFKNIRSHKNQNFTSAGRADSRPPDVRFR